MSELDPVVDVVFHRTLLTNVPTHTPQTGWVKADYELITGMNAGGAWARFNCPSWQEAHQSSQELEPQKQAMGLRMAQKLFDFCGLTVVAGNYDYDCHSFVSFTMGWQEKVAAGSASMVRTGPALRDFEATIANQPYVAHNPNSPCPNVHSFIGTERPGYGLGFLGPGLPLVMSRIADYRRTFGATELFTASNRQ